MYFWVFRSPLSFACCLVWNAFEFVGVCAPFGLAPWLFGKIVGAKKMERIK